MSSFEFKDRSGKVHRINPKGGSSASEEKSSRSPLTRGAKGGKGASQGTSSDEEMPERVAKNLSKISARAGTFADKSPSSELGERVPRGKKFGGHTGAGGSDRPNRAGERAHRGGGADRGGHAAGKKHKQRFKGAARPAKEDVREVKLFESPKKKRSGKHADKLSKPGRRDRDGSRRGGRDMGRDGGRGRRDQLKLTPASKSGEPVKPGFKKIRGSIDKNKRGFGFLAFEKKGLEDVYLNPEVASQFFHGDRVEATLNHRGDVVEISFLNHRFRELVGQFMPSPTAKKGNSGWIVYERKRAREEIFCPDGHPSAKSGDWVHARLDFEATGGEGKLTAHITKVLGPELPASFDVEMISGEYGLVEGHSTAAVKETESFTLDLENTLLDPHRVDLRETPFITIDGETARDFDDAVFVERERSGYILWVAIADVSHYVTDGTALDREARSRGTSVYFPERAFHMLPGALSENLCSLRPNEPRLSLVAKMFFDRNGKRTSTEVMEAVIYSRRRATYNEIEAEKEQFLKNKDWEFKPHFELYDLIKKTRQARGSLDFDLPEAEMNVRPDGEVESIKIRTRKDAHRLIEEFMIAANEAVTQWMMERKWPFMYRVHEEPAELSLQKFQRLSQTVGVPFTWTGQKLNESLAAFVKKIEGSPAAILLNTSLLRSMKQAIYSSTYAGHFGLASDGYTHFTSPIRRYPDLVVHRLIRRALRTEKGEQRTLNTKEKEALERELSDIADHCSYRERLAAEAERESIKLKQVRLMTKHLGDEFDGRIIGMMDAGMFVQMRDPYFEGMLKKEELHDDFYEWNEERMVYVGKRKRRTFKMGDPIKVVILRAEIETRQIDLGLVDKEDTDEMDS